MTSAPINDIATVPAYRGGKKADNGALSQAEEVFGSFQNAMTQARNSQYDEADEGMSVQATGSTRTLDAFSAKTEVKTVEQADTVDKTEDVATEQGAEEVQVDETAKEKIEDVTEETTKDVVEEIADELDIPEDEVIAAMEALGLTAMDLTDPSNMAALVNQLQGESDPMALLTDEGLYATIQQLTESVSEIISEQVEVLANDLDMDPKLVLSMMKEAASAESVATQEVVVEVETDVLTETVDEQTIMTTEVGNHKEESAEESVIADITNIGESTEADTANTQNQSMMDSDRQASPLANQMQQTQNTTTVEAPVQEPNFTSYVDTNEIINQIGEYVKIHRSEGLSEMEIMLNPESLGNIHLQVASKEGVITAVITTQNEAVQEALMVQAMILKEELSAQGMKVDAVEVTVASHEFERDMHEGGEEAKEMFEKEVQKQTRRRLVVDGLMHAEELLADEDLTDADKLQIDMMARSGNSVDFMA
ncbi:MAG: flagellar hook-length control protein FliK [Lachnospiraceae bacterium]|nr:flagellar hook-length control protein FliK [Lachnospiraceae bacterium]